jgi:hypothetical protein
MKKTTLVLGAGASHSYGFPTGNELRKAIIKDLADKGSTLFNMLSTHVPSATDALIDAFRRDFERSQRYSIDRFLTDQPKWSEIGTAAIAIELIKQEQLDQLFRERDDHWYRYLWDRIATSWDALTKSHLNIITFNYDRSLEYYLLAVMKHTFDKSKEECILRLAKIPIIHVYGLIGRPHYADSQGRDFEPTLNEQTIKSATDTLRVIPDHRNSQDVDHFKAIKKMLLPSQVICFLGFGYDEINLERIGMRELVGQMHNGVSKQVCGTTYGLEKAEKKRAITLCGSRGGQFADYTCEKFLRSFGILTN